MIIYQFDGTFEGLLCCLYRSFVQKEIPDMVTSKPVQLSFDMNVFDIETNLNQAKRVSDGINKCGSITLLNRLFYILRSNDSQKENVIFCVARKCLTKRSDITYNYADVDVLLFNELQQKINTEIHRFTGFIRFSKSVNGYWYSHFEPDNDIVDILSKHFLKRFSEPFLLHDVRRNKVTMRVGDKLMTRQLDSPLCIELSPAEEEFEKLFKTYYDSVNVESRKNLKQMYGYMPRRYHSHLPEKKPNKFWE